MKLLLAAITAAIPLFAADTPVQILDTFNLQQAAHWNGVITVSWPAFTASGGTQVAKGSRDYTVTDGAINISLYSTVGANPAFLYVANFRTTDAQNRGLTFRQTWFVPAAGPVTLRDVVRASTIGTGLAYVGPYAGRPAAPHANDLILVSDATSTGSCSTSGGTAYGLCAWNGSAWTAAGGSGGVWGAITGTLGDQTDLQSALDAKEPAITAGTSSQYYRGDKTWQTLNAAAVTNAVDQTVGYDNPSFINFLGWSKISGAPAFPANTISTSHQFFSAYNSTTGAFTKAQPVCGDLSDAAASCSTDATNAANIGSGTLGDGRLSSNVPLKNGTNVFTGTMDASGATRTSPMKVGTSLPGTCTVGDLFFKSDATPGQNIYECTAPNTWTQQLNSGGTPFDPTTSYSNWATQTSAGANTTNPSWTFTNAGASSGGHLTFQFNNNESGVPDFACAQLMNAGSNGATRHDNQRVCGYNVNASAAKQVSGEHQFYESLESDYTTATAVRQLEWYQQFVNSSGTRNFRPFSVTIPLTAAGARADFAVENVYFANEAGTNYASISAASGWVQTGTSFIVASGTGKQANVIADPAVLTGNRSYTFPNTTGTFVVFDTSNVTTLPGGLQIGTAGSIANRVRSAYYYSSDGTGTFLATSGYSGSAMIFKGNDATGPTVAVLRSTSGQTADIFQWQTQAFATIAAIKSDGKGVFNGVGLSTDGSSNIATFNGTFTANRAITVVDAAGTMGLKVSAPGTSSTACIVGQWAADSSYHYDCTATNTWLRVAIATW